MILDSKEQQNTILTLIEVAPIKGSVGEVRPLIAKMEELRKAVREATIEEKKESETQETPKSPPEIGGK